MTLATGSVALAGDGFGPSFGAAAANCPTTSTASGVIEQDGLRAVLGRKGIIAASADDRPEPPGTYPGSIGRDGVIGSKVLWRREPNAFGELRVVARHRMAPNRPVRGSYDNHLGPESTVVPGAIKFTREGCWRITVTSGSARLTAVLWVVNIDAGRNDRFIARQLRLGRKGHSCSARKLCLARRPQNGTVIVSTPAVHGRSRKSARPGIPGWASRISNGVEPMRPPLADEEFGGPAT